MDFDSCFADCCKSCNSASKYRSPKSGQGDCKCGGEIQEQNFWVNAGKGKKPRSKAVREKEKTDLRRDNQKKLTDVGCNCLTKTNKQDCKLKHEAKQEKTEPRIFENCSSTWSSYVSDSWKSRMERFCVSEERRCNDRPTSEKPLSENILELEEKVNFLLRIFKDCGCRLSNEGYIENVAPKPSGTFGDVWHLFNLNKRLCAAEEGIEKLALILEELVKESGKKKACSAAEESGSCGEPLGFEKMTMGERINFLKNRNDMLLSLIKTFLKSSSVEEICSRLSSPPIEYESVPACPNPHFGGNNHSTDFSREAIMEALKNLQVSDYQAQKKTQKYDEQPNSRGGKREHGLKYPASKLEVISEQAELALNQSEDDEDTPTDSPRQNALRNLQGKYSQVENCADSSLGLYDVTSRLLAQEAMLKSSLEKVHLELFSKLDSPEKGFLKANLNMLNGIQSSLERNSNCDCDSLFDCSSDISCSFCEDETPEKPPANDISQVPSKYASAVCREPIREERSFFGNSPNGLSKDSPSKKTDEQTTGKTKFSAKTQNKNSSTAPRSPQKSGRDSCCFTDFCPSSKEAGKHDAQAREQRPLTAPISHRRALPSSNTKSSAPEKNARKNSGINTNVRNKNKILLSKKSFVQTS